MAKSFEMRAARAEQQLARVHHVMDDYTWADWELSFERHLYRVLAGGLENTGVMTRLLQRMPQLQGEVDALRPVARSDLSLDDLEAEPSSDLEAGSNDEDAGSDEESEDEEVNEENEDEEVVEENGAGAEGDAP
jgi:hypothetical protein